MSNAKLFAKHLALAIGMVFYAIGVVSLFLANILTGMVKPGKGEQSK